ncbi:MAG TPA: pentapeptide repeat-containing protein, partial [Verrucomicrobiae bacterium]
NADLRGANFSEADIGMASFRGAQLQGAIMLCIRLEQANFAGAVFDHTTQWPVGFNAIAAGATPFNII